MRELDYGRIGMRIRQIRKAKGWSQDELAKKCGISMSFLGHLERGSRVMSLETFASLCKALDISADELLWGIVQPAETVIGMQGAPKSRSGSENADSYSMYIRIMKSVAEIMSEA